MTRAVEPFPRGEDRDHAGRVGIPSRDGHNDAAPHTWQRDADWPRLQVIGDRRAILARRVGDRTRHLTMSDDLARSARRRDELEPAAGHGDVDECDVSRDDLEPGL